MSNKPRKNNKSAQIPDELLARINEFTSSGFILFTTDINGNLSVHTSVDSQDSFFALNHYASVWLKSIDDTLMQQMVRNIKKNKN